MAALDGYNIFTDNSPETVAKKDGIENGVAELLDMMRLCSHVTDASRITTLILQAFQSGYESGYNAASGVEE